MLLRAAPRSDNDDWCGDYFVAKIGRAQFLAQKKMQDLATRKKLARKSKIGRPILVAKSIANCGVCEMIFVRCDHFCIELRRKNIAILYLGKKLRLLNNDLRDNCKLKYGVGFCFDKLI